MVVDMVRIMNVRILSCNELPDAIIVGIGYPNGATLAEQLSQLSHRRMRDFTPIKDQRSEDWHRSMFPIVEHIESGGADAFLQFLKDELMPRVETEYRVDSTNRCMLGHSLGGRFALHTVFNYPELFQKYVIVSPFGYDNDPWVAKSATRLPARMYLAIDEAELEADPNNRTRFSRLAQVLRNSLSDDTALVEQVFPNNTHCGVVAPAYQAGLVAVLP
jgi:predicted alpha/beta superfamily hydrolase